MAILRYTCRACQNGPWDVDIGDPAAMSAKSQALHQHQKAVVRVIEGNAPRPEQGEVLDTDFYCSSCGEKTELDCTKVG
jgi:hypothetical protein